MLTPELSLLRFLAAMTTPPNVENLPAPVQASADAFFKAWSEIDAQTHKAAYKDALAAVHATLAQPAPIVAPESSPTPAGGGKAGG